MLIATILPFTSIKKWWVRDLDFPRLQVFLVCLFLLSIIIVTQDIQNIGAGSVILMLLLLILYQGYQILPYTVFFTKQVADHNSSEARELISLITMNVRKDNKHSEKCSSIIKKIKPDIALLLEVNDRWISETQEIQSLYKHKILYPLDNKYGMMLLSNLQLSHSQIRFLAEDDIPSIHATVLSPKGNAFNLICLHPVPPSPCGNKSASEDSESRDSELDCVAREIQSSALPGIVIGDLNDVAWSRSTRKFQKESGLLDPRQGRGMFNSFHADYFYLRFPLDHIFCSSHFQCNQLKRLDYIHSDHFPIYAQLSLAIPAKK